MNRNDCEHLGLLLATSNPVNWDLCRSIFKMDDRIEPEYNLFLEAQGESDEIIELTDDLMLKYNGRSYLFTASSALKKTYGECLEEARRTILGDDYDPSLFRV